MNFVKKEKLKKKIMSTGAKYWNIICDKVYYVIIFNKDNLNMPIDSASNYSDISII